MIKLKSEIEIAYMSEAGSLVAKTLEVMKNSLVVGMTTAELDAIAEEYVVANGGIPSFKGLRGFPGSICVSINDEVVHGIPGRRALNNGDIVSIDLGVKMFGFHGDAAITVGVGNVASEYVKLMEVTEQSLWQGIAKAKAGNHLSDISHAVQLWAEKHGYGVVRSLVGHGIGREVHEEPQVPNYGPAGRGPILKAGMTLAIEPMINMGTFKVKTLRDNWTVVTADRKRSAHYEHTIVITDGEPIVLTKN